MDLVMAIGEKTGKYSVGISTKVIQSESTGHIFYAI